MPTANEHNSPSIETQVGVIASQVERIGIDVTEIKRDIHDAATMNEKRYVTRAEFAPVQKLVYGLVGLVLTIVVVALISLVLIDGSNGGVQLTPGKVTSESTSTPPTPGP